MTNKQTKPTPPAAITPGVRGEIPFKNGAFDFAVRPTFQLVATLEAELGESVMALSAKAGQLRLSITELLRIVEIASRHAEKPIETRDRAAFLEDLFNAGYQGWYGPVLALMTAIFATGRPAEKNAKAGETKSS